MLRYRENRAYVHCKINKSMLDSHTSVLNILLKIVWENQNDHGPKPFPRYLQHYPEPVRKLFPKARAYIKRISRHVGMRDLVRGHLHSPVHLTGAAAAAGGGGGRSVFRRRWSCGHAPGLSDRPSAATAAMRAASLAAAVFTAWVALSHAASVARQTFETEDAVIIDGEIDALEEGGGVGELGSLSTITIVQADICTLYIYLLAPFK